MFGRNETDGEHSALSNPGARRECWIRFRADYRAWTWIYIIYEFSLTLCARSMVIGKLMN